MQAHLSTPEPANAPAALCTYAESMGRNPMLGALDHARVDQIPGQLLGQQSCSVEVLLISMCW